MKLARILATGLISLGAISTYAQNISFGIIATDSASAQRERWEPFFRDREKKTGLKIQVMLNEGCIKNCPFRNTHFAIIANNIEDNRENKKK